MDIEPELHRSKIEALLRDVGLGDCLLPIVDSVQDWARQFGIQEDDPFRAAMAARRSDGRPAIVLLRQIRPDIRSSILPAMEIRGFGTEVERLRDPSAFLEHLVLHEAAHLLLPDGATESDCDRWAFQHRSEGGSLQNAQRE